MSDHTLRKYKLRLAEVRQEGQPWVGPAGFMEPSDEGEYALAADVTAVLAGKNKQREDDIEALRQFYNSGLAMKDAELERLNTIAEEQRLREYKLVESLQATKSELARVHSELEIAMRQGGTARTKLMLENRDLRADLEQAKAQGAQVLSDGVAWSKRANEAETQRDRAEVACAEYRRRLEIMVREWKEIIGDAESNRTPGDTLERAEHVLKQPNPGQRYLDLEEHLDHTETDRDGLEGLLQQISDAMGCKQYRYTAATKRVLDLAKLVEDIQRNEVISPELMNTLLAWRREQG